MADDDKGEGGAGAASIVREVAAMAVGAYVLVLLASLVVPFIPFVGGSLYLIVALVFICLPYYWLEHNDWDFARFGLTTDGLWKGVAWGLGLTVLTAGPFAAGFYIWETEFLGANYAFEWSNFQRWQPELQGRPSGWGEDAGVWTWTQDREVHVGLRAGQTVPLAVKLEADRAFEIDKVGPVQLVPLDGSGGDAEGGRERSTDGAGNKRARSWRVKIWRPHKRAELTIAPAGPGTASFPANVSVSIVDNRDAYDLRVGRNGTVATGDSRSLQRDHWWIFLWLMTQVAFIALPEEYFYRGYVQTRVADAIEAHRSDGVDGADGTRSWLGISEQNIVASLAFGIGHLLIPVNGRILLNRVAVAVPSVVFGWLRDRTGSISASVVYHAGCNMLVLLAEPHFF